jgi:serine/threonine-protein kinase
MFTPSTSARVLVSTTLREQLQATLGGTYTLERELGGGGMSRVFVAEDSRLGRRVVVKVLAPELTEGLSAERFAREVWLAARLQHPNIVPVLAAEEREGLAYYTMPYVEGESLRARLVREGRLPVDAAVSVLRDVARALEYAHVHGVVHRDIKPDNVLLAGSASAVADFGIAKALVASATEGAPAGGAGVGRLTLVSTVIGTPAYMAPEQAAGDPDVDARADLYAWGVVAYELLAGAPPFGERTPHRLVAAHIAELPPSLAERAPDVPPALVALVMLCLEKDRARRPQSAGEVLAALEAARTPSGELASTSRSAPPLIVPRLTAPRRRVRAVLGAVVAVLLGALGVLVAVTASRARRPAAPEPFVLAVLPFENLGPAADAYFADGLTDEVRGRLAGIAGLRVIGGTSARQYKGTTKGPREIARELGATHLLTASVRWERGPNGVGRVRVSPELVRAADQASVWAEPVEGPLNDVFALQARVAERVAAALDVTLLAEERRAALPAPPTQNPAAYDAYLHGLAYGVEMFRFATPAERRAASAAFERAIALDPRFAAAHARLAEVYLSEWAYGQATGMLERARASAARAMALDSTRLESRLAQASVLVANDDPDGARRALEAAARHAPSSAEVHYQLGLVYEMLGHPEDAVPSLQQAAVLEPRWSTPVGALAGVYDKMFRYEEAIRAREREIALSTAAPAAFARVYQAASYLLWRADTAVARRQLEPHDPGDDPRPVLDLAIRAPSALAGYATIVLHVFPPAVLAAKDTMTLAGYLRGDWATPELFHLMKARHFWLTGRRDRARAHADSLIALLEPVVRSGAATVTSPGLFPPRGMLAEAYAYAGRPADAARSIDAHVEQRRRGPAPNWDINLPNALVTAAYVDMLIGRRDLAVARLAEALRLPSGQFISPALLRADPSWAPLRGRPEFDRLLRGD